MSRRSRAGSSTTRRLVILRVQIGLGYNYNGDHPKAIAMLKSTLRDYAENGGVNLGHIYAALARTYRSISEYPIARDYAQRALEYFRQSGEWRGLAEVVFWRLAWPIFRKVTTRRDSKISNRH